MNAISVAIFIIYVASIVSLLGLIMSLLVGARYAARNLIYLLTIFLGYITALFTSQFIFTGNHRLSEVFLRISLFFASFIVVCTYFFLRQKIKNFKSSSLMYLGLASLVIGVLCAFPALVSINFTVTKEGIGINDAGILYNLFILLVLSGFLTTIISLERQKKHIEIQQKPALNLIKNSFVIALFLNLLGALLSRYTWSQILTPVSMTLLGVMIYISIFKHQLFNIRLVIARSIAYTLSLFSVSAIYALVTFLIIDRLLFPKNQLSFYQGAVFTFLAVFLSFSLQPVKRFFNRISNAIFYQDAYDPQQLLDKLNRALVSNIEIDNLLHKSSTIITSTVKSEYCTFVIHSAGEATFRYFGERNLKLDPEEVSNLHKAFNKNHNRKSLTPNEDSGLDELMKKHSIGLIARLSTHNSHLGYLVLGDKLSGSPYSIADIKIANILTDELAIAIQNALRFEEIQNFNETLQGKVEDATKQLRSANQRLKELDQTKDEFISMASHQLRTPLTTIKGYLSMVLEGDVGPVTKDERKMIQQAFDSSERMVFLIGDLLNISRLQSGKFVIENKPTNLAKMVGDQVSQLKETAANHHLTLDFKRPDKFPTLNLDETKIQQVVMNFMDNAIFYTPAGGRIDVALEATDHEIRYTVTDTGLGVPKSEQHHLFAKFYRAGNARKMRPDGTGLGLFMAKKVIAAQGGAIIFNSTEGKGSTFGFSFPRSKVEAAK